MAGNMGANTTEGTTSKPRKYTPRRESWGRLRKLPSGRYQASYVGPDGNTYPAPMTYSDKGDAQTWLSGIRTDIQRGNWKSPKAIQAELFGEYARAWIETQISASGEPLRPRTRAEYLRYLDKGLEPLTGERLDAITKAMVRAWHLKRLKAGKTAAAREARLLRAVMNAAIADELIEKNPVDSSLTRTAAGLKHRPPSEAELAGILETFKEVAPELRLAVMLAAYGGLRLSEWRALRRSDLTLDGERYAVNVTRQVQRVPLSLREAGGPDWMVGPPKSAEGVRVVTLPAWMTADVEAHLKTHVARFKGALLFAPSGGAQFLDDKRFNKPWNVARDRLKLRVRVSGKGEPARYESVVREHDLRAFAGTYYVRAGATLREVQTLLGHSTTEAALAYQHAVGDRVAELADRMPAPSAAPPLPVNLDEARGAKA